MSAFGLVACGGASDASIFGDAGPLADDAADNTDQMSFGDTHNKGTFGDAGPAFFYSNDDTTLYQLDPSNLSAPMVTIGNFDCVPSQTAVMTDIAVSKDGKLYGVSPTAAWPLTITQAQSSDGGPGTVHCEAKWPLPFDTHFNGLTMAPENTVAAQEVLIGGNATGQLYQIDQSSGMPTQVGTLGINPQNMLPWGISGDIVFMANNGSPIGFATVRTCQGAVNCDWVDTLIEIDVNAVKPGTQSVVKSIRGPIQKGAWCKNAASPMSFGSIFGIVALEDRVYGFSRKGDFIEMLNTDGSGCLVWSAPTVKFAGAGITTVAPVIAPPPK